MSVLERARPFFPEGVGEVELHVEEIADEETLEALFIEDPMLLKGAYSGMTNALELHAVKSDADIWIFRQPILLHWVKAGDLVLESLIAAAVLAELAGHFRWNSEQVQKLKNALDIPDVEI